MSSIFFSPLWSKLLGKRKVNILMVGLDTAGKTTICQTLLGQSKQLMPVPGWVVSFYSYSGLTLTSFDISDPDKSSVLWPNYYPNVDALIFVIDASDMERIGSAATELNRMLAQEDLKNCTVLVMANKQDISNAMNPNQVTEIIGLSQLVGRKWQVQGTSAVTGQGLKEGLDWIAGVQLKKA